MSATPDRLAIESARALVNRALAERRMSRAELARRLGIKPQVVTNTLNGNGRLYGLTLRTLAKYLHACGYELLLNAAAVEMFGGEHART